VGAQTAEYTECHAGQARVYVLGDMYNYVCVHIHMDLHMDMDMIRSLSGSRHIADADNRQTEGGH